MTDSSKYFDGKTQLSSRMIIGKVVFSGHPGKFIIKGKLKKDL
jgi:hypothetical protein